MRYMYRPCPPSWYKSACMRAYASLQLVGAPIAESKKSNVVAITKATRNNLSICSASFASPHPFSAPDNIVSGTVCRGKFGQGTGKGLSRIAQNRLHSENCGFSSRDTPTDFVYQFCMPPQRPHRAQGVSPRSCRRGRRRARARWKALRAAATPLVGPPHRNRRPLRSHLAKAHVKRMDDSRCQRTASAAVACQGPWPPHFTAEGNFHATHRSANELCGRHLKLDLTFDIRPN
jgi:hypothetical protein